MREFTPEQQYVADTFQNKMQDLRGEPIALYGFGRNTEAILGLSSGYTFIGVLGPDRTDGSIYGLPVISLDTVVAQNGTIVIVAPEASRHIIFRRIQEFVEANNISVYDYAGKKYERIQKAYVRPNSEYWSHTWEELCYQIETHDVISFDIFDTLVGRYVLRPYDIFSIIEKEIKCSTGKAIPFKDLRKEAEYNCEYGETIFDIYQKLCEKGFSKEQCGEWLAREVSLEEKLTFRKERMGEAFDYAVSLGKLVYLTSDMYLTRGQIEKILSQCRINGYTELLVSCEEKAEKKDGTLFAALIGRVHGKSILHIGDNKYSDVVIPQRMGIDVWHAMSGYDLFMVSSISDMLAENGPSLSNHLALGMICAKLFSDPFALHQSRGQVELKEPGDVGYCFIGPWAMSVTDWIIEKLQTYQINQMIYPSRDGFLFYKIGKIMQEHRLFPSVSQQYIKASRRALMMANVFTVADIMDIVKQDRFRGSKGEMLQKWFRVVPEFEDNEKDDTVSSAEDAFAYLKRYIPQILERAQLERNNYLRYLQTVISSDGQHMALFDFVGEGSVHHYLERLLGVEMLGLYCGTRNHPNRWFPKNGHVLAAYGNSDSYDNPRLIFRVFMALEALLVDGDSSLAYIEEAGCLVFQENKGVTYEMALQVQDFACRFVSEFIDKFSDIAISLDTGEKVLAMLFRSACKVEGLVLKAFCHDDAPILGESAYYTID